MKLQKLQSKEVVTTKDLKKLSLTDLRKFADQMATKLLFMHSTGKQETEKYKRACGELYHLSQLIEQKELLKKSK
jgi:hypothetical protein